jgi:hypothetical protein
LATAKAVHPSPVMEGKAIAAPWGFKGGNGAAAFLMISNQRHSVVIDRNIFYVIPKYRLPEWKKRKSIPDWADKVGEDLTILDFGSYVIDES